MTEHSSIEGHPEVPEGAVQLVRQGPEAQFLRERLERPGRLGRYLFLGLGAVTASAGIAAYLTHALLIGLALGAFGGVLLALGLVQHVLLRRDDRHWPVEAYLWKEGLELILQNGEVRGANWSDPDFGLTLLSRPAPSPADREFLLVWMMDARIPSVEVSEEGFLLVRQEAEAQKLLIAERRRGKGQRETVNFDIRQFAAGESPDLDTSATPNRSP